MNAIKNSFSFFKFNFFKSKPVENAVPFYLMPKSGFPIKFRHIKVFLVNLKSKKCIYKFLLDMEYGLTLFLMGCHIGSYFYRKEYGQKAHDSMIANPFKIDFYFKTNDPLVFPEFLKVQTTLLYSSNEFELGMNLGILALIGRHFEIVLGKKALLKMYIYNSLLTSLCFIPGTLKYNTINLNSDHNKYSSTFSMCLCSTYYFLSFVGLTSVKVGCLAFYLYLIYKDTNYDINVGLVSGALLSILLKRRFLL